MPFFDMRDLQQVFYIAPLQHNADYVIITEGYPWQQYVKLAAVL